MSKLYHKVLKNSNWMAIDGRKRGAYNLAIANGASKDLADMQGWFLNEELSGIRTDNGVISPKEQFAKWRKMWNNPFCYDYTCIISSNPDDTNAQVAAMRMFLRASSISSQKRVLWHQVYGGYGKDALRDAPRNADIGYLVISNVPDFSTVTKREKVRDIIVKYSVPKIIVTTGSPKKTEHRLRVKADFFLSIGKEVNETDKTTSF